MARPEVVSPENFLSPTDKSNRGPSMPPTTTEPRIQHHLKDMPPIAHTSAARSEQPSRLPTAMTRNFSRPSHQPYSHQATLHRSEYQDRDDDQQETMRSSFSSTALANSSSSRSRKNNTSLDSTMNSSTTTTEYSPNSSRPPSLSLSSSRDSEYGHYDSPITPHRPYALNGAPVTRNDATSAALPHQFLLAPPSADVFPQGSTSTKDGRATSPTPPAATDPAEPRGKFTRLRHAASASNIGRTFTKRGRGAAVAPESSADEFPARKTAYDDRTVRRGGHQVRAPSPSAFSLSSRDEDAILTRPRKSSFLDVVRPEFSRGNSSASQQPSEGEGEKVKKNKAGKIWGQLFNKQVQQTNNISRSAQVPSDYSFPQSEAHNVAKIDRLSGRDEQEEVGLKQTKPFDVSEGERLRALNKTPRPSRADVAAAEKLRAQDVLAEYSADWRPPYRQGSSSRNFTPGHQRQQGSTGSNHSNISSSAVSLSSIPPSRSNHNYNVSTSSRDTFATASTAETRVSDQAPVLDHPLLLAGRDLSDDIEAMLRSQRGSVQDLEDLLNAHRHITKQRASHLPKRRSKDKAHAASSSVGSPAFNVMPLSSSPSTAHSPQKPLPSLPQPIPIKHAAKSSVSSSNTDWSISSPSHSMPFESSSKTGLGLMEETLNGVPTLSRPPRLGPKSDLRKGSSGSESLNPRKEEVRNELALPIARKLTPDQFQDAPESKISSSAVGQEVDRSQGATVGNASSLLSSSFNNVRPPMRGAVTSDAVNFALPTYRKVASQPVVDGDYSSPREEKASEKETDVISASSPTGSRSLKARTTQTLSSLPPLSSLLEACLVATGNSKKSAKGPWHQGQEQQLSLTFNTPKEYLPRTWPAYIQAYARGDCDINSPPVPLTAPIVQRAHSHSVRKPRLPPPSVRKSSFGAGSTIDGMAELGQDFAFPLPPARSQPGAQSTGTSGFMKLLKSSRKGVASSGDTSAISTPAMSRVTSIAESEGVESYLASRQDKELFQAVELATLGGIGDFKAARPPFEAKRQQATLLYLSALGLVPMKGNGHGSNPSETIRERGYAYRNARLISIVEQIAGLLNTAEASIQLLSDDDVVLIAHTGQRVGGVEDASRTPRPSTAEGRGTGGAGALGVNLFEQSESRRSSIAIPEDLRDDSLDGHAILSRNGMPMVLPHIQNDWRFSARVPGSGPSGSACFWAAVSIMSSDGLPIGTISIHDFVPRPEGLSKDERSQLTEAAKEATLELERIRRVDLGNRLALLDESLLSWSTADHRQVINEPTNSSTHGLLAPPRPAEAAMTLPLQAPPSPNGSLAQRRGVKAPRNLEVKPSGSASTVKDGRHPELATLQAALRTIASALSMDIAYIAQVGARPASIPTEFAAGVECTLIARYDSCLSFAPPEIHPDGPLHLCALAATKRGLHFQQDPQRAAQLLGHPMPNSSSSTSTTFQTAAVVSCGLKDAGKGAKGTEGWVLAVASCAPQARLSPEGTIYLLRFASLLTPFLWDGPRSPLPSINTSSQALNSGGTSGRARGLSSPALPKFRPPLGGENRSRSISFSRGSPGNVPYPPLPPPSGALPSPPPFSPSTTGSAGGSSRPGSASGNSPATSFRRLTPAAALPLSPPPTDPLPPVPKTSGSGGNGTTVSSPLRTFSPLPPTNDSPTNQSQSSSVPGSAGTRPSPPIRSISQPRAGQQQGDHHHHRTAMLNRHKARSSSAQLDAETVGSLSLASAAELVGRM